MLDRFGWMVQWGLTLGLGMVLWPRLGGWTLVAAPALGVLGTVLLAGLVGLAGRVGR